MSENENSPQKMRVSEITIGDTIFTVESVQSEHARESAYTKIKKLILNNCTEIFPKAG